MSANNTGVSRTGTVTVGGQVFTVTQAIAGTYPLISTLAGGAMPATAAQGTSISVPVGYGLVTDSFGNAFFSSPTLDAVFKADPNGVVTRIAGTGVAGFSGDSGPALSAQLSNPNGLALDAQGNLYVADTNNNRIRKIDTSGTITTVAGNGNCCYYGDNGQAVNAYLDNPYGVAVDASGNLYIADTYNNRIRRVDSSGKITTFAGDGNYNYAAMAVRPPAPSSGTHGLWPLTPRATCTSRTGTTTASGRSQRARGSLPPSRALAVPVTAAMAARRWAHPSTSRPALQWTPPGIYTLPTITTTESGWFLPRPRRALSRRWQEMALAAMEAMAEQRPALISTTRQPLPSTQAGTSILRTPATAGFAK